MFGRRHGNTQPRNISPASLSPLQKSGKGEEEENISPYLRESTVAADTPEVKQDANPLSPTRRVKYNQLKDSIYNSLIATADIKTLVSGDAEGAKRELRKKIAEVIANDGVVISDAEERRIILDITNEIMGLGPLEPLLARDDIADIMVNGADKCYIEVSGKIELTDIKFASNKQLMNICQRIVMQVGRRVDDSSPICDARLLDGSRVNVIAPPLAIDGPTLTIRKFKKDKLRLKNLVDFGAITPDGAVLLEIIGHCRCNVLISGGTGSGKTTLLNCLTGFIEEGERVITCEDSAELQLQQPHVVRLETRPANLEGKGEVTMRDLVKNCLRMRPERIIVGEVRGPEAFDLLQAMNTGHDGSMGTLHANSPREAISRMESMITMGGFSLPSKTVREMIVSALDVIVQAERLRDGSRKITSISEVIGMEGETVVMQEIFKYQIEGENKEGKLLGSHRGTGIARPKFWERARYYGRGEELVATLERASSAQPQQPPQNAASPQPTTPSPAAKQEKRFGR